MESNQRGEIADRSGAKKMNRRKSILRSKRAAGAARRRKRKINDDARLKGDSRLEGQGLQWIEGRLN